MPETISKKVLDEIKEKKVALKPRWQFVVKNYTVWLLGLVSLMIGSLSFAVILYMLKNNDWDVHSQVSGNIFSFVILTLPYFWLIFLGIFILATYYNIRHTKKGYRFSIAKVVLGTVVVSVVAGGLLYNAGVGRAIDNIVEKRVPFYDKFINHRKARWEDHDGGFLAGAVVDVDRDKAVIKDISGDIWYISDFSTSSPQVFKVKKGDIIRILGEKIDDENFRAREVLPMKGMPWMGGHRPCGENCPFERKMNYLRITE